MTDIVFNETAINSSYVFRTVLSAMSRPGTIHALRPTTLTPEPLLPGTSAILLMLCDFQTPVYLSATLTSPDVAKHLQFHTGAPLTSQPGDCSIAVLAAGHAMPILAAFPQGSHEYPDRSATLIIQVHDLSNDGAILLSGPGISSEIALNVLGVDHNFWREMIVNHAGFPVGVDVLFVSPFAICACPRSTTICLKGAV